MNRQASLSLTANRTAAFSDGVIAVIFTVLVLDLRVPAHGSPDPEALRPSAVAYPSRTGFLKSRLQREANYEASKRRDPTIYAADPAEVCTTAGSTPNSQSFH